MSRHELVSKLLSRNTLTRAALALTVVTLGAGCVATAPAGPTTLPQIESTVVPSVGNIPSETRYFQVADDPQLWRAVQTMFDFPLSEAARKAIQLNDVRGISLSGPISIVEQDGKITTSDGWYSFKPKVLVQKELQGETTGVIYNPEERRIIKFAVDTEYNFYIDYEVAGLKVSLGHSGYASQVAPITLQYQGQQYHAVSIPHLPGADIRYLKGKIPAQSMAGLTEEAFVELVRVAREGKIVHDDPALINAIADSAGEHVTWIDFSSSYTIDHYDASVLWNLWRRYSFALNNIGLPPIKYFSPEELLTARNATELLPPPSSATNILVTPVAAALNRYLSMRNGEVEGVIVPGRVRSLPDIIGENGERIPATSFALESEFVSSSTGQVSQIWRMVGKVGSAGIRIALPILEGTVYFVGADILAQAIDPAENPVEKIDVINHDEAYKTKYQKEIMAQQILDKLFGSIFYSKQFWANRFQSDQDNNLRTELWKPYLLEEKALLALYPLSPNVSLQKLTEIKQQYRANVVQDLIQKSLIGYKQLEISDSILKDVPFNEEIYISATSADQSGKSDNHLVVWTALPEANNQKKIVVLLEMVQTKEGGVWQMVQQSDMPLSIKVNGQDRTAKLFQFAGNLNIKINAVKK